ncbi:hypothetical protein MANY_30490 [Mycolicibacterium anyangense]|uniref:Uncharacterized protein n=1 Tax=Mycolicibacterium anyangense TaxID=1431246 RepID=A0A6N4WCD4_9MYCO|nr:hypothetical protein MANY_30490 [Mycolicibacterium anyangense]
MVTLAGRAEMALAETAAGETTAGCALCVAAAFGPAWVAVERAEEAWAADESEASAQATADPPSAAAPIPAPIPRATARPPTRPMTLAALTAPPIDNANN